jgi:hypothetical protein
MKIDRAADSAGANACLLRFQVPHFVLDEFAAFLDSHCDTPGEQVYVQTLYSMWCITIFSSNGTYFTPSSMLDLTDSALERAARGLQA